MWTYPNSDLDRVTQVLDLLGSFWSRLYEGQDLLRGLLRARLDLGRQVVTDLREAAACLNRRTVPLLHREHWRLLTVRRSQRGQVTPRYGDAGLTHGGSPLATYGRPLQRDLPTWEIAAEWREIPFLQNRLTRASTIWVEGCEYRFDAARSVLEFARDPFTDGDFAVRPVFDDEGVAVDDELLLWVPEAGLHRDYLGDHWAFLINLTVPPTETSRTAVAAALDAIVGGTVARDTDALLAAAVGAALAVGPGTVEIVAADQTNQFIVTDQHVYRFAAAATPLVAVGDLVGEGDALTDAVQVYELNRGAPEALTALTLGRGLLVGHYLGELTFRNTDVPLEVTTVADRTRVSFEVGGWPFDVEQFWDEVHVRGLRQGRTLAQYLDRRSSPSTEPEAIHLPATINPLTFLVDNLLASNIWVARVRLEALDATQRIADTLKALRRILPPQTAVLLVLDLPLLQDSATMTADETPAVFTAAEPLDESGVLRQDAEQPLGRVISTVCQ